MAGPCFQSLAVFRPIIDICAMAIRAIGLGLEDRHRGATKSPDDSTTLVGVA
jgi:hypothetical protein